MSGERPPWTQRTAPLGFDAEPELEEVAPVPAGPVLDGVACEGELEVWED